MKKKLLVCIDDNWRINGKRGKQLTTNPLPKEGEIYTLDREDDVCLFLVEFTWFWPRGKRVGFAKHMFRPVDYSVGEIVAEFFEKQLEPQLA